jgi:DNA polymerase-1
LNYLIQGTAADIMKAVMLRVDRLFLRLGLEAYILNTIHDELIFEIRKEDDTEDFHFALRNVMQNWPEFDPIPLTVNCKKVIDYWGHHEEVW